MGSNMPPVHTHTLSLSLSTQSMLCVHLNFSKSKCSGVWSCATSHECQGNRQKGSSSWDPEKRLLSDTARAQPVPYPTDRYQPAAIKYGWQPIYQEENSLTSLLSTFCIIFPCLLWKCKTEAKIRSWGAKAAGVCGEKAERRCRREGFGGRLPGAPSWAVTDSSLEKKYKGRGTEAGSCWSPQLSHLQRILEAFLGSVKTPWPTFQNVVSLFTKTHS